jgi:hypothetical protein
MNARLTSILVAIALALAAYIYTTDSGRGMAVKSTEGAVVRFVPLVRESIRAIELTRSNDVVVARVERSDGGWMMRTPVNYPAESRLLESLLESLANLKPTSWIPPTPSAGADALKPFGLDNESSSLLKVETSTGPVFLRLGGMAPLGNQFYFERLGTAGIFTAPSALLDRIPVSTADWRDRSLVPGTNPQFDHVELRGKTAFEAVLDPVSGIWRLVRPLMARADSERIQALLYGIFSTRITAFTTDASLPDLDAYGLQPPEAELVLSLGTNVISQLQFGRSPTNATGMMYVRRMANTNIVLIATNLTTFYRRPLAEYRDHQLFAGLDQASQIAVALYTNRTTLERVGTNWSIVTPEKHPASTDEVGALLTILKNLKIRDYVDDVVADYSRYGLAPPYASIAVSSGTNPPVELQLSPPNGGEKVFARRTDEPGVYSIGSADLAALPFSAVQLRECHFAPSNVVRVVVKQQGRSRILERMADGTWRISQGNGAGFVAASAEETVYRLGSLNAFRLNIDERQATNVASFKQLAHEIVIQMAPGNAIQQYRLRIVFDGGDQVYALLNLDDGPQAVGINIPGPLYADLLRDFSAPE